MYRYIYGDEESWEVMPAHWYLPEMDELELGHRAAVSMKTQKIIAGKIGGDLVAHLLEGEPF